VSVTLVPDVYVRVKVVDPVVAPLASAGDTLIDTPDEGLAESTVRTYVVGPWPPPGLPETPLHPASSTARLIERGNPTLAAKAPARSGWVAVAEVRFRGRNGARDRVGALSSNIFGFSSCLNV